MSLDISLLQKDELLDFVISKNYSACKNSESNLVSGSKSHFYMSYLNMAVNQEISSLSWRIVKQNSLINFIIA